MELIERVEQLERELKALRPELHFPSTATLEQRLRWLEIVLEEMRAKDNHGVYAETLTEEKLRQLLHHTVYIKQDRITLMSLTADPASCAAGDEWFRSDLGKAKLAVDAVVANTKLLRREGDTIPAAEIASLDASKITTGRFGTAQMPDGTSGQVLTAQGVGVNPVYAAGGAKVATSSYTGDGSSGRQITVGFKCSLVIIIGPYDGAEQEWTLVPGRTNSHSYGTSPWHRLQAGGTGGTYVYIHATDGFVVDILAIDGTTRGPNYSGSVYYYTAISL